MPGTLMLLDIWKDGRCCLRAPVARELMAILKSQERDLSWFDYSYPGDLSSDARSCCSHEEGSGGAWLIESGGLTYAVLRS